MCELTSATGPTPGTAQAGPVRRNLTFVLGASAVSGVGDGMLAAALPLLAAALTRDPFAVAAVSFAASLPWLVVGLVSGALVDRWDRRLVMVWTDVARTVLMLVLAAAVIADAATIPLLMAVSFGLGVGDTLFDNAEHSIVPSVVGTGSSALERANSYLQASDIVGVRFVGPALGGWLFAAAQPSPFVVDAVSFGLSALALVAVRGRYRVVRDSRPHIRRDIAEGLRYLVASQFLRRLALAVGLINLVAMAQLSVLVLLAQGPLRISATGYGVFLTTGAVGALFGTVMARRVRRWLGLRTALVLALTGNGVGAAVVGVATGMVLAGVGLALGSFSMVIWNVLTVSLRQRSVPAGLLGRVNSAYRLIAYGSMPVGALVGGVVSRLAGLRTPFVAGGVAIVAVALTVVPLMLSSRDVDPGEAA